mgnify:CR=1 FL=1
MDSQKIRRLAEHMQELAVSVLPDLREQVTCVIQTACRDRQRVEHLLDQLLDFAFHDEVREEFRRLCRYWHEHDPETTAFYILAYRELWDDGAQSVEPCESS